MVTVKGKNLLLSCKFFPLKVRPSLERLFQQGEQGGSRESCSPWRTFKGKNLLLWCKFFPLKVGPSLERLFQQGEQGGSRESCSLWKNRQKNMEMYPYTLSKADLPHLKGKQILFTSNCIFCGLQEKESDIKLLRRLIRYEWFKRSIHVEQNNSIIPLQHVLLANEILLMCCTPYMDLWDQDVWLCAD